MNNKFKSQKILAILNCVNDEIFHDVDPVHMEAFAQALPAALGRPDMPVPRTDDTLPPMNTSEFTEAERIALKKIYNEAAEGKGIFGEPTFASGGSLANTAAGLAHSYANGRPLSDVTILTILGEGAPGQAFRDSFPKGVVLEEVIHGEAMSVKVVNVGGGRSQFPVFPDLDKNNKTISANIYDHVAKGGYDSVWFEGFRANPFDPHSSSEMHTLLESIKIGNHRRRLRGLEPMQMVVSAGAQFICDNPVYRDFVKKVSEITPIRIHANTGEFRRMLNNDEQWRKDCVEADFHAQGLSGDALEQAKQGSAEYRTAKTAANLDSIRIFIEEWAGQSAYPLEAVITDGGNTGYVVFYGGVYEYTPEPIDKALIKSKVGAGDAFMGGYSICRDQLGLNPAESMEGGDLFAKHVLMRSEARPQNDLDYGGYTGPVALLAKGGLIPAVSQEPENVPELYSLP